MARTHISSLPFTLQFDSLLAITSLTDIIIGRLWVGPFLVPCIIDFIEKGLGIVYGLRLGKVIAMSLQPHLLIIGCPFLACHCWLSRRRMQSVYEFEL